MGKTIESPVKHFPGTVTLKDPLPLSACVEWEAGLDDCRPHPCPDGRKIIVDLADAEADKRSGIVAEYGKHFASCDKCKPGLSDTAAQERMIKAIRACILEWHINNFDLANPPGSPKLSRSKFVGWLIDEVTKVYVAEEPDGDPNA